jgi:hypothetical protein
MITRQQGGLSFKTEQSKLWPRLGSENHFYNCDSSFCRCKVFLASLSTRNVVYLIIQGCQMVCIQTKNLNLGKFWRALDWKLLMYFMAIGNILQRFGILYDHLVHFVFIWYIFPVLVSCTMKNLATLPTNRKTQVWHFFYVYIQLVLTCILCVIIAT